MFLRNYDNIIVLYHFSSGTGLTHDYSNKLFIGSSTVFGDGNINVRSSNGTVQGFRKFGNMNYVQYITSLSSSRICLGTGTTPVTYEDYTLSGTVLDNSKLTYVSYKIDYDATNRKVSKTVTYTYTNETEEAITISEWGLFFNYYEVNGGFRFVNDGYVVLLYREVLETPITIEPGTSATLKFKIDIPINHP